MILNGEPLPNAVVIQMPKAVFENLTNQYTNTGTSDVPTGSDNNAAETSAIRHIDRVIKKYLAAGVFYVLTDEDFKMYPNWSLNMKS